MTLDPLAELEAKLFAAAREEQPDADLLQRVLRASREADALDGRDVALRPALPRAKRRFGLARRRLGWLLAAAAVAATVGLVWFAPSGSPGELAISAERAPRHSDPVQPSNSPSPSAPAVSMPAPAVPTPPITPAEAAAPAPAVKSEPPDRARPHAARGATAPQREPSAGNAPPAATLATEISVLKQAREALRQGDTARASSVLDAYDAAHGSALGDEATLLRIEVLAAQGHSEQARGLAQRFLADNPNSPLADRARRMSEPGRTAPIVSP